LLVIAPALNSRLRYWLSDEDEARRSAYLRLADSLERLRAAGFEAVGRIGDPDPMQAIADALHEYGADQIVISTRREGRSHWLVRDVVERARRRFAQPVVQVVVEQRENSALYPLTSPKPQRRPGAKNAVTARAQEAGT
jgi:nucleotide-binding universal stress UspA family protein